MGIGKWIGGVVGFMTMGPLGALAGYALGSMLDNATDEDSQPNSDYGTDASQDAAEEAGQRNSFLFAMLVMASYIIRADGRIMHSEMEFVRRFLRTNFGDQAAVEGNQILLNLFEQRKRMDRHDPNAFHRTIRDCGSQLASNLNYGERLQLLDFLVRIARADGVVSPEEVDALREVAQCMGLSVGEVDSMLNMGGATLDEAYQVLGVPATATDEEVRAAYRQLVLKHHPDRVATLGDDVRRAAEEKLQRINDAKERIYKARGMR